MVHNGLMAGVNVDWKDLDFCISGEESKADLTPFSPQLLNEYDKWYHHAGRGGVLRSSSFAFYSRYCASRLFQSRAGT